MEILFGSDIVVAVIPVITGMSGKLMDDVQDSDDSGEIKLSASTLAALQEFYAEQSALEHCLVPDDHCQLDRNPSQVGMPAEDWVTGLHLDYNRGCNGVT